MTRQPQFPAEGREMKMYSLSQSDKDQVRTLLAALLRKRKEILFAYLHGSFAESDFRDIDIAIFLKNEMGKKESLQYELGVERVAEEAVGYPVDVRVLNYAPLPFRFRVVQDGEVLFSSDDDVRCSFEGRTLVEHHDFEFHHRNYRREILGTV